MESALVFDVVEHFEIIKNANKSGIHDLACELLSVY
jgi:hypothetical protein